MDKLIITVTCDSTMSYPRNPNNPTPHGLQAVADEYIRSVNAGASICHLHGPYTVDEKIQPDGTKLSDLDIPGWARFREMILERCDPVIQYGIANGRFPQRKELMKQRPDMMSICFNAHDECFDNEPGYPPVELYGLHNREELTEYCKVTAQHGVKPEVEAFHYGGIWNAQRLEGGLLDASHAEGAHVHARSQAREVRLQRQRDGSAHALAGAHDVNPVRRARPGRHGRQPLPEPGGAGEE